MPVSLSHRSRTWSVFKTLNKYNYSVHNNLRLFFSFFFFLVNSTFETDLSLYIWLQFIKFTYSMLSHSISSTLYFSCVNRHWDCFYFFHYFCTLNEVNIKRQSTGISQCWIKKLQNYLNGKITVSPNGTLVLRSMPLLMEVYQRFSIIYFTKPVLFSNNIAL